MCKAYDPSTLQSNLGVAAQQADEEAEAIAEQFIEGTLSLLTVCLLIFVCLTPVAIQFRATKHSADALPAPVVRVPLVGLIHTGHEMPRARKLEHFSFDVACVQCEYSH